MWVSTDATVELQYCGSVFQEEDDSRGPLALSAVTRLNGMLDITNARRRRDEKTEGGLLPTFLSRPMRAVRRRPRRWVLIALATVVCFTYFYFGHRTGEDVSWEDSWKAGKARTEEGGRQDAVVRQKLSIIVIWQDRGGEPPLYLPYFFQSVEANPDVDLLFINVDKEQKDCASYSRASNVQEVCLTEKQCAFRPPPPPNYYKSFLSP